MEENGNFDHPEENFEQSLDFNGQTDEKEKESMDEIEKPDKALTPAEIEFHAKALNIPIIFIKTYAAFEKSLEPMVATFRDEYTKDINRLNELERENGELKETLTYQNLEIAELKRIIGN